MNKNIITLILIAGCFNIHGQINSKRLPDYFGEHIRYELNVGFFQIGEVDISFRGDSAACGAYVSSFARSTGVVSFIKDVRYDFDACVDTSTGYTTQSKRWIKEGDYKDYDEVHYNRAVIPDSTRIITEDFDTLVVASDIRDILFAFFDFRKNHITHNMQIGDTIKLHTFFVDTEWDLNIIYGGVEKIKTDIGTAKCYIFHPLTEPGKYFKNRDDMTIWVTANRHHIPLRIEARMKLATFTAEIVEYKKDK